MRNRILILISLLIINSATATELQSMPKILAEPVIIPTDQTYKKADEPLKVATSADIPTYDKISLPESIDYSLGHNLDIQGNRLNIDIAKNDIKKANRLKNPYFTAYLNSGRAATDNPNYFGIYFPIEIAKRAARKKLAKSTYELTKGQVALAELYLRLDVRQNYVDLVAAKSMLIILNEQRKLLQDLLNVAQKKYDAGAVPQMDVIHAKMTLNQLLIQFNTANTEVFVARYNFNKILNSQNFDTREDYLPEQKDFIFLLTPKPTEKMPPFNEIAEIAIQKRLDLKNAQQEIDVAKKDLITVIRKRVPDIELGVGAMIVPAQYAADEQLSKGAYLGLNVLDIPLFYQYTPEIKNAKIKVEQKQLAYEALKNQTMMNLHSAYDEFTTARDNLNYYNDVLLAESKQFLHMAKRSYQVGKSSITDYIFIQQSYKLILIGYTRALSDYYYAWINVIKEVNDEELLNG